MSKAVRLLTLFWIGVLVILLFPRIEVSLPYSTFQEILRTNPGLISEVDLSDGTVRFIGVDKEFKAGFTLQGEAQKCLDKNVRVVSSIRCGFGQSYLLQIIFVGISLSAAAVFAIRWILSRAHVVTPDLVKGLQARTRTRRESVG
jgi:hypothetical protein